MSTTRQYAKGTYVGIGRTRDEINAELDRIGATKRGTLEDARQAAIVFEREGVRYRLLLPMPDPADTKYHWTPARRFTRDAAEAKKAWMQDCNERWRQLGAYIKALRVGWEAGIIKIEEALLAHAVLGDDRTVYEHVAPEIADWQQRGGGYGALLPGIDGPRTPPASRSITMLPAPDEGE